jgi:glycosyltransferase involved in cell wall biosynthesis
MSAGFTEARGEIVIPMDGDLQNDPKDIPRLMEKIGEGFDVVSGWRKDRKDKSLSRKLPSLIANKMIGLMSGVTIHDYGCTLKAYRKEALDGIRLYGEMHRFIPAYIAWNGGRVTEMVVTHHERTAGVSKYGLSRTAKVILDLLVLKFLTAYMNRPIHFFGVAGLLSILLGSVSGIASLVLKFGYAVSFVETPLPLLTVFLAFLGVQFILMGLLAEMLMRVYYESQEKTTYVIAERING